MEFPGLGSFVGWCGGGPTHYVVTPNWSQAELGLGWAVTNVLGPSGVDLQMLESKFS